MPRKKADIHYIYKTTCTVTGKYYIGMHSTANVDDGYMGSGKRLRRSIRKYGEQNHVREILEYCESRELLIMREKQIVTSQLICDDKCMNLKEGGYGGLKGLPLSTLQKISKAGNEKIKWLRENNEEWRETESKLRSEWIYARFAKGLNPSLGNKSHSGRTLSEDHKIRIGISSSIHQTGTNNSQYGTCWVTKDGINKKIKKDNVDEYLRLGWSKGRYV